MDDKMLKDFDRHIEQLMNESSVTPPFGTWNRITAELDAAPIVNPTAGSGAGSIAQPLLNTGTVLGFISGALLIGTVVTGWLLYNSYNNNNPSSTPSPVNTTTPVEEIIIPSTQPTATKVISQKPVQVKTTRITTGVTKTTNIPQKNITPPQNNEEVAAPTVKLPMDKEKNADEAYYFPPVDINTGTEILQKNTAPVAESDKIHDEVDEPKITKKVTQSNSSGERIKFKKKRKTNWTYGRLNRTKNKSKY